MVERRRRRGKRKQQAHGSRWRSLIFVQRLCLNLSSAVPITSSEEGGRLRCPSESNYSSSAISSNLHSRSAERDLSRCASLISSTSPSSLHLTDLASLSRLLADDQAALDAAIAASLGEAPPSRTSSPPAVSSSTPTSTSVFAPFPGPPPPLPARPPPPARASSTEAPPSIDPPPAYTPMGQARPEETTVDAGPMRPAFTEPEPRQFQHQQQTVGTWIEPQHTGWSDGGGNPGESLSSSARKQNALSSTRLLHILQAATSAPNRPASVHR